MVWRSMGWIVGATKLDSFLLDICAGGATANKTAEEGNK